MPALIREESCNGYMVKVKGASRFPQTIDIASTVGVALAQRIGAIIREQMRAVGSC
ncbi:MAG: hypothetical protein K6T83_08790 [Alicyclobacillus sp.]|nr:hypothetical protein [Alicyclobacillus sp.]